MSRVTIEDCVASIANRFRLVMCSAQRGRELASGVEPTVERDRVIKQEKNAVIALREITQGNLDVEALEDSIVRNHRRFSPIEDAADEGSEKDEGRAPLLSAEGAASSVAGSDELLPEIHAEAVFGAEKATDDTVSDPSDPSDPSGISDTSGISSDTEDASASASASDSGGAVADDGEGS